MKNKNYRKIRVISYRSLQDKPMHSNLYIKKHSWIWLIAMLLLTSLLTIFVFATSLWIDLSTATVSRQEKIIPQKGVNQENSIIDVNAGKTINILLIGSDSREGTDNTEIGGSGQSDGTMRSDTTMVMQISADRTYINLVSIPRDSLVDTPQCQTSNGTVPAQYNVMFNSIFSTGWEIGGNLSSAATCVLVSLNALTGLDIQNFIIADFNGMKNIIDSIGGVDICVTTDMYDDYTGINLNRGLHHLNGLEATQYARTRHATGTDGTDVMRTTRQQYLIKKLVKEILQKNFLLHTQQLYQLIQFGLQSLTFSENLSDITVLAGIALSLKNIKMDHLYFQTLPVIPAPSDLNRRIWAPTANSIWEKMRNGKPLIEENNNDLAQQTTPSENNNAIEEDDTNKPSIDNSTGLISMNDGTLIDPNTGGIVIPDTGYIIDSNTGEYLGLANKYLEYKFCSISN